MTDPSLTRRRRLWSSATLVPTLAVWALAAWFGRDTRRWAIELTNSLFAFGLIVSYLAAWFLRLIYTNGPRRRAAFQAITTTLVLLVMVLTLELPAYLGVFDYCAFWESVTGEWRGPASTFDVDLEFGFRRRPNIRMVGRYSGDLAIAWNMPRRAARQLEFTFNGQGFRSRTDYTAADVVMLGDSFIEGWFVSDGETCADRLADRTGLTVANLGQSGYGTLQELRMLELYGLALRPRLVVWFFYEGNDLYDDEDFEGNLSYFRRVGGTVAELRQRLGWTRSSFRDASFSIHAFDALRRSCDWLVPNSMPHFGWFRDDQGGRQRVLFHGEGTSELGDYELERFEKTKTALTAGKALCNEYGIGLIVCCIPAKFRVYAGICEFAESSPCNQWRLWSLPEHFKAFCDDAKIPCVDLTQPMRDAAAAGRLLYSATDTHWDQNGHAFVAELLAEKCRDSAIFQRD